MEDIQGLPVRDDEARDICEHDYDYEVPDPEATKELLRKWLRDRGGIVVYVNQTLDSSQLGAKSLMPLNFVAEEDNKMHPASKRIGDVPSRFKEAVDVITAEQFGGDIEKAVSWFSLHKEIL